jgi:hypothetical protein
MKMYSGQVSGTSLGGTTAPTSIISRNQAPMHIEMFRNPGCVQLSALLALLIAPLVAPVAFGQESSRGETLDEIVVTATRMQS